MTTTAGIAVGKSMASTDSQSDAHSAVVRVQTVVAVPPGVYVGGGLGGAKARFFRTPRAACLSVASTGPRGARALRERAARPGSPADHGYPNVIWLLLSGNLVVRAAGFAYPFMAFHVAGRGYTAGAVGVVLAAFGLGWATGQLTCGWLVDRIGPRATLSSTMLLAAAVLALMAEAHTVPALVVGAMVTGVVYDAPRPVLGAAIAELVPDPRRRAKIDAWRFGWIVSIGRAITGGIGGLLAGWSGVPLLFWVNAAACAMLALVAACCIPAPTRVATGRTATRRHRRHPVVTRSVADHTSCRRAFSDGRLVLLFLSSLATLTAVRGLYAAVPMLMADRGLGATEFGWAQLANAVAGSGLTPLITPWLGRKVVARIQPRLDILAVAGGWTAMSMAGAALAHTTLGFAVATAACTPGEIAWFVIAAGVVHRIAPPASGGRYHGIWSMTLAIASVIAPIMASYSLTHGGHRAVALVTVTVGMIGAALCLPLGRTLRGSTTVPALSGCRSARS
ncbi:MFS transporter [Mycobacterium basiliense]|uniref:MFS transporter n=1 Tax=Mycobacterium basiliense TaxID=2094119 RepID=UPI0038CC0C7D